MYCKRQALLLLSASTLAKLDNPSEARADPTKHKKVSARFIFHQSYINIMAVPTGFVDLSAAYNAAPGTFVNIIGVVVDLMQPSTTRSNEWMLTFKLLDQRLRDAAYGAQGLTVRFFRADPKMLPKIGNIGDVVLLRRIKIQPFANQRMAISNFQTSALVFPAASIPDPSFGIAFMGTTKMNCLGVPAEVAKLGPQEQGCVIQLKADLSGSIAQIPRPAAVDPSRKRDTAPLPDLAPLGKRARPSTFGNKFMLVEELQNRKFADMCVQVVKKFPNQYGTCELYITDYTANKEVWYYTPPEEETDAQRDGDEYGYSGIQKKSWPGPYGWLVLKVNAKDVHAQYANKEVTEGDFVLLKNVKMKAMAMGAKLEGDMWRDDLHPDRVNVVKVLDQGLPEMKELLARKDQYWAARRSKEPGSLEGPTNISKSEKTRRKKKRQQERARAAAAEAGQATEANETDTKAVKRDDGTNKHVRCTNTEVPLTSVRDIIDQDNLRHTNQLANDNTYALPFVNAKYRARVRVVDFQPKALEDFAVTPLPEDEDTEMSPIDMEWEASTPKLEWFFELVLEEAGKRSGPEKAQIQVSVAHEEAQYLFGKDMPDPEDLRSNPQLLAKLKEKMCILWGNLEEKDEETVLSNRSFECCISEYGQKVEDDDPDRALYPLGWEKMFRMHGTTIL